MCLLLNIIAGAVFPFFMAELLVMFCATTGPIPMQHSLLPSSSLHCAGATFSFLISSYLGRGVISFYGFDPMLEDYRKKVAMSAELVLLEPDIASWVMTGE